MFVRMDYSGFATGLPMVAAAAASAAAGFDVSGVSRGMGVLGGGGGVGIPVGAGMGTVGYDRFAKEQPYVLWEEPYGLNAGVGTTTAAGAGVSLSVNGFDTGFSEGFRFKDFARRKPRERSPNNVQDLYKTELCNSYTEIGSCSYGANCQFAHGFEELRAVTRHPKYKTKMCRNYAEKGECPYGSRCRFIHGDEDEALLELENNEEQNGQPFMAPTPFHPVSRVNAAGLPGSQLPPMFPINTNINTSTGSITNVDILSQKLAQQHLGSALTSHSPTPTPTPTRTPPPRHMAVSGTRSPTQVLATTVPTLHVVRATTPTSVGREPTRSPPVGREPTQTPPVREPTPPVNESAPTPPVRAPTPPVLASTPPVRAPTPPVRAPTPPVRAPTPTSAADAKGDADLPKKRLAIFQQLAN